MNYAQLFAAYEEQLVAIGEEAESLSFTFRGLKGLNFTEFLLLLRQKLHRLTKKRLMRFFSNFPNTDLPSTLSARLIFMAWSLRWMSES